MEKTITVDGKELKLKANARNALIYRAAFGEDIFKVQGSFARTINDRGELVVENIDCLGIMKLVWTMAKAADSSTTEFEKWLDTFDEFPIMDVFAELQEMLMINMTSTTKIKNAKAAVNSQRKA